MVFVAIKYTRRVYITVVRYYTGISVDCRRQNQQQTERFCRAGWEFLKKYRTKKQRRVLLNTGTTCLFTNI